MIDVSIRYVSVEPRYFGRDKTAPSHEELVKRPEIKSSEDAAAFAKKSGFRVVRFVSTLDSVDFLP